MTDNFYIEQQGCGVFHLLKMHEGTDEIVGVYETLRQAENELSRLQDEATHGK